MEVLRVNKTQGNFIFDPKYSSVRAVKNWILDDLYVKEDYRN